ncbi:UNVERIFIED_CONTAM: hypothetical protein FKN15_052911 [Acipenser sinensis]
MSGNVGVEVLVVGGASPPADANAPLVANESLALKTRPQTTAFILPATSSPLSLAVRNGEGPRVAMETPKVGVAGELMTSTLTPQVGGACSLVHVLEWKEGVAVLPGSNLKFRMSDFGTLQVVSDRKTPVLEPSTEGPAGKEVETDRVLGQSSVPGEVKKEAWTWSLYLEEQKAVAAPLKLFQEVCGYRMRLHFDGYSECHDFWVNANSPDIHPAGWCEKTEHKLYTPKGQRAEGCKEEEFSWASYLRLTKAQVAPRELFASPGGTEPPCSFQVGMKLEAVDRMNPSLICVATVTDVVDKRFLVHFDNWDDTYDYWCDETSPYIHPVGWCQERGRPLTPPQVPVEVKKEAWTWSLYLEEQKAVAAPLKLFQEVCGYRMRLHFDGYSECHDFWVNANSPDIHPAGWCEKTEHKLYTPKGQRAEGMSAEVMHPSLFMSALSAHPDRTLSLCWEQHCKLLPGVAGIHASNVATWSVEEVSSFVQNLTGCDEQARVFKDEMIDGEAFLLLTQTDIVKIMSIKLGPALKIYNAILVFKSTDDSLK